MRSRRFRPKRSITVMAIIVNTRFVKPMTTDCRRALVRAGPRHLEDVGRVVDEGVDAGELVERWPP